MIELNYILPNGKLVWWNNNIYFNTNDGVNGIGELKSFSRTFQLQDQEISGSSSFVLEVPEHPDYYNWDCVCLGANISNVEDLDTSTKYLVTFGLDPHQGSNLCITTNNTSLGLPTNLYPRYTFYNNLYTWSGNVLCISRYNGSDDAQKYGFVNASKTNNIADFSKINGNIRVQMYDIEYNKFGRVRITGTIFLYCYDFT